MFKPFFSFESMAHVSTDAHQLRYILGVAPYSLRTRGGFDRNHLSTRVDPVSHAEAVDAILDSPDVIPRIAISSLTTIHTASTHPWFKAVPGVGEVYKTTLSEAGDSPCNPATSPKREVRKLITHQNAQLQIEEVTGLRKLAFTDKIRDRKGETSVVERITTALRGHGRLIFPEVTLSLLGDEEPVVFPGELEGEFAIVHNSDDINPLLMRSDYVGSLVLVPGVENCFI